jgi:hypothetical protein
MKGSFIDILSSNINYNNKERIESSFSQLEVFQNANCLLTYGHYYLNYSLIQIYTM